MKLQEYLQENRLITDGAMGTYYEEKYGEDGLLTELANLKYPERIAAIHREYLEAGARLIRTNTFAANTMFVDKMETVLDTVKAGYRLARQEADCFMKSHPEQQVYVAADLGPIYDMEYAGYEQVVEEYRRICDAFLECGADLFVFETQNDFTYLKPVTDYIRQHTEAFILVQFAVDKSGYTRAGLSMKRVIEQAAMAESIDAYGFNCGMDSTHLYQMLKDVAFPNEKYISALPNAGYPCVLRGRTIYANNADYFVEKMNLAAGLGVDIVGGCCGTTPAYIRALAKSLAGKQKMPKRVGVAEKEHRQKRHSALEEKLKHGEKAYIVELDPPFQLDTHKVEENARLLKEAGVDLITLSDSPMARTRMDAGQLAIRLRQECQVDVMPHIACRDRNVIAMRGNLLGMHRNGIRHFLVVTGDPVSRADRERVKSVFDFNSIKFMEYIQEMNQDVFAEEPVLYGGALNYQGINVDAIVKRMELKMEAGCSFFLTQPVYTTEDVERLRLLKERTKARLLCGIMPLVSYKNACFVQSVMPGIRVTDEVVTRYREDMSREEAEEAAVEISLEMADQMYDFADGFYLMTPFNRAGLIKRIIEKIRSRHNRA